MPMAERPEFDSARRARIAGESHVPPLRVAEERKGVTEDGGERLDGEAYGADAGHALVHLRRHAVLLHEHRVLGGTEERVRHTLAQDMHHTQRHYALRSKRLHRTAENRECLDKGHGREKCREVRMRHACESPSESGRRPRCCSRCCQQLLRLP